jgi:ATP-binding protein involved in chromosome partitioning
MSDSYVPEYQPKKPAAHGACDATPSGDQFDQQEQRLRRQSEAIAHKILVLSGKGGVGKSTVAANLAWALALRDKRVGLLDADINGPTIPLLTGLRDHTAHTGGTFGPVPILEHFRVMSISFLLDSPDTPTIWRGPLKGGIIRQFVADVDWGALDYLVVDLPPGTGDEPLTVGQMFPDADGGVIVTTPQEASLSVCRKAINFLKAMQLPCLGVIENMSGFICPHCGEETPIFAQGGGEEMARQMGVPFLGRLPLAPEVVRLSDGGQPLLGAEASPALREAFDRIVTSLVGAP